MAYTEFEFIQKGARPPIPLSDRDVIEDYIEEAELLLSERLGPVAAWVGADDSGRGERVKRVVKRMVRRVLKNPDGFESESAGDYTYTRSRALRSGEIYAGDSDWKLLGLARRKVRTIRIGLPADSPRNMS